jgi:ABC-type multidrug transport system ATPase subunit
MIEITNLLYGYPNSDFRIDIPLSLTIGKGITGLLGRNGAGKTTFLRIVSGLIKNVKGQIKILNYNMKNEKDYEILKKNIFYIPDESFLFDSLTIQENFELFCDIRFGNRYIYKKSTDIIQYFGLEDFLQKPFGICSHGTRKKAELVCSFIASPKVYIFDEPYNGLDVLSIKLFNDLLERNKNAIIILSSHIVTILEQIADRVLIIDNGSLVDDLNLPISKKLENYYFEKVFNQKPIYNKS